MEFIMGLFKPNYLKPGKGISPDEPEKRSFFIYWEILKDKFSKILGLNIIYVLLSLPFIAIIFLLIPINYDWLKNLVPQIDEASISAIYVLLKLLLSLVIFSVFLPLQEMKLLVLHLLRVCISTSLQ